MKLLTRISSIRADRLERVQVVLAGLVLDVAGLVGQPARRRVHPLAGVLEHRGDRVLREPVDLEVGMQLAQLLDDRDVAAGVAEADGRREVQRPLAPAGRGAPRGTHGPAGSVGRTRRSRGSGG